MAEKKLVEDVPGAQTILSILLVVSIIAMVLYGFSAFAEYFDRFTGYTIKIIDTNIIIASFAPVISLTLLAIFLLMCKSFLKK